MSTDHQPIAVATQLTVLGLALFVVCGMLLVLTGNAAAGATAAAGLLVAATGQALSALVPQPVEANTRRRGPRD